MATKWGNAGDPVGPKFYKGTSTAPIWNQDLNKRAMNQNESDYLLAIQAGTHASQTVLRDKGPIVSSRTKNSKHTSLSKMSNMTNRIGELADFNSNMRKELRALKGYLVETNKHLTQVAASAQSGATTRRSKSTMGGGTPVRGVVSREFPKSTARSASVLDSAAMSARSGEDAGDDIDEDYDDRVSTPVREWLGRVGHLTGAEVCQPGGQPKRMGRNDAENPAFIRGLIQGSKKCKGLGYPGNIPVSRGTEVSEAISAAREAISRGSPAKHKSQGS